MDLGKRQELFVQERRYLHNVSRSTLEWYKYSFRAFAPHLKDCQQPEGLRPALKSAVIALRERNLQAVSLNDYIRAVNAFLRWAKEEDYLVAGEFPPTFSLLTFPELLPKTLRLPSAENACRRI